jgi:hypothetical protein
MKKQSFPLAVSPLLRALTHQTCYGGMGSCVIQNATDVNPKREGENEEANQIDGFSRKVVHRETL